MGAAHTIEDSPIKGEVRSGYDVRLLADLIDDGIAPEKLPESRVGLDDQQVVWEFFAALITPKKKS